MSHFDEMTFLLYLEKQLDAGRAREVSAHAASCAGCRELLRVLGSEETWLRESLRAEDESVPARLIEAPERGSTPWGWIAALGLAMGGAYTLWGGIVEPWRAQAAQAGFTQGNLLTMLFFSGAFWKGWDAMRNLMEFMALATLGVAVMWLLRRHWRRPTAFAVVMGAMLCALALPRSAGAGELHHGDPNYTLPAGQEVKTDLIVSAAITRIDGDVDGDLIVFSKSVTVNGHVKGDVLAFGKELRIIGPVDGNVRATCSSVVLEGPVAKNVMVWAGEFILDQKGKVGGTLTLGTGDGQLSGQLGKDLLAFTGSLDIDGSVGGNARIDSGHLSLGPGSEIVGATKYEGSNPAEIAPGAKLGSPIEFIQRKHGPRYATPRFYWHQTLLWGASFLFGITMLLLAPGFFFDATSACKRFGLSTGFGILFLIATPIAAVIVCFTIVGIGVGIAALLLYLIGLYAAQVFVGSWLGEKMLGASHGVPAAMGRLALGLAVCRALRMLPYLGAFATSVVLVWGLGAMVLAIYKHVRPQLAAA